MRFTVALLLCLPFAAIATAEPPVEVIAHRGASSDGPENTVEAMQMAWEQGADASEFDVHLSKDGKAVVIHDADTKRTASVDKKILMQTLAELRALDVGRWKGPAFAGARIPTLDEVLAAVPAGKKVFVEIKCGPEVIPELKRALKASGLKADRTPVIAFDARVIAAVKKAMPELLAYWLVSLKPKEKGKQPPTAEEVIAKAKEIRADGLDLSAVKAVDAEYARKVKAAGLKPYVWTVNDAAVARRMVKLGVDGITTDRPGWVRKRLAEGK